MNKENWLTIRNKALLLPSLIILGVVACNLLWIHLETRPPHWDMGRHLWTSLLYLNDIRQHHFSSIFGTYHYYPPFLYWLTVPFYLVFGVSTPTAILSNVVFVTILVLSTYALGKRLWSQRVGVVAALMVVGFPILVSQFKEYQIDAPLTAVTALALYILVCSQEFTNSSYSYWLGLVLGIGLLTKWTFPFVMLVPLGYAVLKGLVIAWRERDWQPVRNMVFSLLIAYFVASYWYILNHHQLLGDLRQNNAGAGAAEGDPVVGTLASNTWYLWNLLNVQLYLLPTLTFLVGLVGLFSWKKARQQNLYPLLLCLGVFFFFTLLRNKDARYTMPLLSAVAILSSYWLECIKQNWQKWATGIVSGYSILAFLIISFGISFLPKQVLIPLGEKQIVVAAQNGYIIGPPSGEHWYQEELVKDVAAYPASERKLLYKGSESIWLNGWGLTYYREKYGVVDALTLDNANFVEIRQDAIPVPTGFTLLDSRVLPDSESLRLYKRSTIL